MPHPGGRPSKYDPSFCEEAILYVGGGKSKEAFAGHLGVSKQTLYNWMKENKEFLDSIKVAEAMSQDFWEELGIIGTIEGKNFNATTWIFNMKNRFAWKDKMELAGDKDNPLSIYSNLSDGQLDQLIQSRIAQVGISTVVGGETKPDETKSDEVRSTTSETT